MKQTEKSYPYSRGMMLNVIYDTLDRLGISVLSTNSDRGRIRFRSHSGKDCILKIDTVYPDKTVKIAMESEPEDTDFANVMFDEINSTIASIRIAA